ncbi:hypothetical protein KFE25_007954 [Diacronema lutheri]|uniref:Transcription factor CBF/NF-Y/archaeal histone domain-containing protein n=1 Tax=Diacronema lutheri TaxID=2081491 RepID=A0A8J5XRH1_DIALT|nr:hypothetical protein KFE25_007954 [Diacronema lutheri]
MASFDAHDLELLMPGADLLPGDADLLTGPDANSFIEDVFKTLLDECAEPDVDNFPRLGEVGDGADDLHAPAEDLRRSDTNEISNVAPPAPPSAVTCVPPPRVHRDPDEPLLHLSDRTNSDKANAIKAHCQKRAREIIDPRHKHDLPIARVKRLMKEHSCENPNAIAADVPGMLARAVEMFVLHVAAQGSLVAIEQGRCVLQARDVKVVLDRDPQYAFLQEIYDECSQANRA